MDASKKHIFVISFDGLSTLDFDYISKLPNFKRLLENSSYCKNVRTIYPSLTYPAHVSIVTGKYPKNHGIINNTLLQPGKKSPDWFWHRKDIKGNTFYDMAIKRGMKVAALLWPVTAKSNIQYNMPEIFANRRWHNQILVSIFNGSPLYQLKLNKMFGYLRKGLKQPHLDNFTHKSFLYTIENKMPNVSLVHYTDLDSMRHMHSFNSIEAKEALMRHDDRLGEIIDLLIKLNIYEDSTIIALGDHSSIDEDKIINLNVYLSNHGYININSKGEIKDYSVIAKSCDGSAYVYIKDNNNIELKNEILKLLNKFNGIYDCFENIYSSEEAESFGADPTCSFMLEASIGYYFLDDLEGLEIMHIDPLEFGSSVHITASTHGYSPNKKDYTTVFIAKGKGIKKNVVIEDMCLIDEGPTISKILGFELTDTDGRILNEIIE